MTPTSDVGGVTAPKSSGAGSPPAPDTTSYPATYSGTDPAPAVEVDWALAARVGARVTPPGPKVSPSEAAAVVADLRAAAAEAREPVAAVTGLLSAPAPPALVVDRSAWVRANVASMAALVEPVVRKMSDAVLARASADASGRARAQRPSALMTAVGASITGTETGALLGFMSTKVLGQYDLAPQGTPLLMLVAPNIVQVERELDVDPHDFRRWVAMHEETHRLQFTAVPWLRGHLVDASRDLALELAPTPAELAERLRDIARRLPEAFAPGSTGLTEVFMTAEQKERLAGLTAVMSLLEGHADVMMDEVGPQVIPTVETIRARFTVRRQGLHELERVLRRLLGFEAKLRQYEDGAGFVRAVRDRVGLDGFNAVWTSPQTLPTAAEISDPDAWVARVHGP